MYPNPTGRTNIGDRTPDLVHNDDGSLTITVTHEAPAEPDSRLPAPAGTFYLVFGCDGARRRIVDGDWTPHPFNGPTDHDEILRQGRPRRPPYGALRRCGRLGTW